MEQSPLSRQSPLFGIGIRRHVRARARNIRPRAAIFCEFLFPSRLRVNDYITRTVKAAMSTCRHWPRSVCDPPRVVVIQRVPTADRMSDRRRVSTGNAWGDRAAAPHLDGTVACGPLPIRERSDAQSKDPDGWSALHSRGKPGRSRKGPAQPGFRWVLRVRPSILPLRGAMRPRLLISPRCLPRTADASHCARAGAPVSAPPRRCGCAARRTDR